MFWRIIAWTAAAAIALIGCAAYAAPASGPVHASAGAFLRSAEALYEASLKGDTLLIRQKLRETEAGLRALPMQRIATAEGIEGLARSVSRMKRAVASVSGDDGLRRGLAAEIRLAADALAHPEAPIWHRYRPVIAEDVRSLAGTLEESGASPDAWAGLDRLKVHYGLIRTAAMLDAEPYVIERADSVLRYAERVLTAPSANPGLLEGLMPSVKESMEGLFPPDRLSESALIGPMATPPWGWPALMGTFIVTVLSWAGWQRYRNIDPVTPRGILPRERREHR